MTDILRPDILRLGSAEVALPVFFPSISSVKTSLPPLEYVRLLNALPELKGKYLVSAFDLLHLGDHEREAMQRELKSALDKGTLILMDSGNYESYWKGEQSSWLQNDFHQALKDFPCSFAFGFDEHFPPDDLHSHIKLICERYIEDQAAAGNSTIIPIMHASIEQLPELCLAVAEATGVSMLAVAERWLGLGIYERANTVAMIRQSLNKADRYVGLHLLGTGNPLSKAIYTIAGADSFDGLEWCQTVVDHETAQLHHLSHGDFYKQQTKWGESEGISYQAWVLAHNLEFYSEWMSRLRRACNDGDVVEFCRLHFPSQVFSHCAATFGWRVK